MAFTTLKNICRSNSSICIIDEGKRRSSWFKLILQACINSFYIGHPSSQGCKQRNIPISRLRFLLFSSRNAKAYDAWFPCIFMCYHNNCIKHSKMYFKIIGQYIHFYGSRVRSFSRSLVLALAMLKINLLYSLCDEWKIGFEVILEHIITHLMPVSQVGKFVFTRSCAQTSG